MLSAPCALLLAPFSLLPANFLRVFVVEQILKVETAAGDQSNDSRDSAIARTMSICAPTGFMDMG